MKVLFLKDVGGVAQRNTVKEVSDGYALNYLIPRGLAVQATPDKLVAHAKATAASEAVSKETDAKKAAQIRAADGQKVVIKAKANEQGHLFKGIKKEDISEAIADAFGALIDPRTIAGTLDIIKEAGEYSIKLAGAGAEGTVSLVVEATN